MIDRRGFALSFAVGIFAKSASATPIDEAFRQVAQLHEVRSDEHSTHNAYDHAEHWAYRRNDAWTWYERETYIDGHWQISGLTTPRRRDSGALHTEQTGYLSEDLVPQDVFQGIPLKADGYPADGPRQGQPSAERRSRHGRPPSEWLRSLPPDRLRKWLDTISVPEAGVAGMTFWIHLTRDHQFSAQHLEGLSLNQIAKLHAAAHYGF
ncbi:MAG TPA: hypothetical protein DDW52_18325 [Planctomycetaceae bacterium]|nr:hypothetical protein [Planctomycetaceae bacterium]